MEVAASIDCESLHFDLSLVAIYSLHPNLRMYDNFTYLLFCVPRFHVQMRPSRRTTAVGGGPHHGGGGVGGRRGGKKGGRSKKAPPLHKINGLDLLHTQTLLSTNDQGKQQPFLLQ